MKLFFKPFFFRCMAGFLFVISIHHKSIYLLGFSVFSQIALPNHNKEKHRGT